MPTIYRVRSPLSFTQIEYNANISYDEPIRYDGLTIFNTAYRTPNRVGNYLWSATIQPWRNDFQPWLWKGPTTYAPRPII